MSPMAKMPGSLVWNFAVSTLDRLLVQIEPPLGDRPELRMQTEKREHVVGVERGGRAVAELDLDTLEPTVGDAQRRGRALDVLQASGGNQLAHPRHRRRRGAELGAAMHVDETGGLTAEVEHPVERGVAAAEDHQPLAVKARGVAHPIMQLPALDRVRARHRQPLRLERSETAGDHHGAGEERAYRAQSARRTGRRRDA